MVLLQSQKNLLMFLLQGLLQEHQQVLLQLQGPQQMFLQLLQQGLLQLQPQQVLLQLQHQQLLLEEKLFNRCFFSCSLSRCFFSCSLNRCFFWSRCFFISAGASSAPAGASSVAFLDRCFSSGAGVFFSIIAAALRLS